MSLLELRSIIMHTLSSNRDIFNGDAKMGNGGGCNIVSINFALKNILLLCKNSLLLLL